MLWEDSKEKNFFLWKKTILIKDARIRNLN